MKWDCRTVRPRRRLDGAGTPQRPRLEPTEPRPLGSGCLALDVVIQREFVRMRPQSHGVRFVLPLVIDVANCCKGASPLTLMSFRSTFTLTPCRPRLSLRLSRMCV